MAENELTVIRADGATKTLRATDLGAGFHVQFATIFEAPEVPVDPTGGAVRYTVDSDPAVLLDPPNAATRFARIRVYETAGPANSARRLYYRTDGTTPLSNGSNAFGFLLHGESILVRLANAANFKMIADSTDNGIFEVYVEWLNIPTS